MQIWDRSSKTKGLVGLYEGVDGVIVVYDMTDANSFDNLHHWLDEAEEVIWVQHPPIPAPPSTRPSLSPTVTLRHPPPPSATLHHSPPFSMRMNTFISSSLEPRAI